MLANAQVSRAMAKPDNYLQANKASYLMIHLMYLMASWIAHAGSS